MATKTYRVTAWRLLAGLLATVAVLVLSTAPSTQAAPLSGGLPPIGAEIPMSMLALNTPLTIRTALVTLDFKGGIKVRVEPNPNDPVNSRRLRVIGFRMVADLPEIRAATGQRVGGGLITIEQNDVDVDPKSLLRITQSFPPKFEQIMVLSFTMTIDQPDSSARYEPLVLTTKNPAQLIGTLTQFPPKGDLYQLQNPVDLVLPDDPDVTIATIQKFPVQVGGL